MLGKSYSEFTDFKKKLSNTPQLKDKPAKREALTGFWKRAKFSIKFMFTEKEALFFALLQWFVIILVYLLWVQMLAWIPDEVWQSAQDSDEGSIVDWILLLWSFVCVGIAAFPIGILSGCMGASYLLKRRTGSSDIASCFAIVLPNALPIWIFSWIDGWWTVSRILDRLPKKNDRTPVAVRLAKEAAYYAWKVGTIGILPALTTGRGVLGATKHSFALVTRCTKDVLITRAGYSILCWIIGVGTYIGGIFFIIAFPDLFSGDTGSGEFIYSFYMLAGIPIFFSVGIIMLFIRPIYIISSFAIYENYLDKTGEDILIQKAGSGTKALTFFCIFLLIIASLYIFREHLGIGDMLSVPYGEEYIPQK